MSAASARQSQRVLIDAPVQLRLRDADRTLPARALDLSEGAMRLSSDAPVCVGDEVTCDLELDNEHAALSGHVRWSKPAAAAVGGAGIGVQFGQLSEDQLGLLRRWLAHNNEHVETVLLHVPSMREPLRARGSVTADGLQLIAALPQLTPGSELEFQLGEHGTRRLARIERIELKTAGDKRPLELAVRLQPSAATRSRRNLVYGLGEAEGPELPPAAPAWTAGAPANVRRPRVQPGRNKGPSSRHERGDIPKTRAAPLLRRAGGLLAAGGAAVFLWSRLIAPTEQGAERAPNAWVVQPNTATSTTVSAAAETAPLHAAGGQPHAASQPAVPATLQAPAPAASTPAPGRVVNTSAAQTGTANTLSQEEARLPALNSFGAKSEIFVPMQGTLNGLRSTQWTDPLAVVLDLPNAHIDAPELLRGLRGGGVRRVRLDDTRPVPRLQIFLNTVTARFATRTVPHGLLVVLEHDLRPMPN